MSGLTFRQGTVYTDDKGCGFLLINHNPMALQSLQIPGENGVYECANAAILNIDDLIAIRKEGKVQDKGDLPAEHLAGILTEVLKKAVLPESDRPLLENILQEITHG